MEVEEKIFSLFYLMGTFEKNNFEYSLKLSELSDLKKQQMNDLLIKTNESVNKNKKKYIKYIFSEDNIVEILKEEKKIKKNRKKYHNPTSISISTKLDSNDDDNSN